MHTSTITRNIINSKRYTVATFAHYKRNLQKKDHRYFVVIFFSFVYLFGSRVFSVLCFFLLSCQWQKAAPNGRKTTITTQNTKNCRGQKSILPLVPPPPPLCVRGDYNSTIVICLPQQYFSLITSDGLCVRAFCPVGFYQHPNVKGGFLTQRRAPSI